MQWLALAKTLLEGREYETLNLTDYRINFYGQTLEGDQFDEVYKKMAEGAIKAEMRSSNP